MKGLFKWEERRSICLFNPTHCPYNDLHFFSNSLSLALIHSPDLLRAFHHIFLLVLTCAASRQAHGQKASWEDPVEWVRGTLPWPSAQQDQAKLFHLPPPSIGSSSPGQTLEDRPHKETPPSSMESDPLVSEPAVASKETVQCGKLSKFDTLDL